jgi:hypothetical protein
MHKELTTLHKTPQSKRRQRTLKLRKFKVLDTNSREGRHVHAIRAALYDQLGGEPTPAQQLIVRSAAIKALKLELMLPRVFKENSDRQDLTAYLAVARELRKDLKILGMDRVTQTPAKLQDYLKLVEEKKAS